MRWTSVGTEIYVEERRRVSRKGSKSVSYSDRCLV